MSRVSQVKGGGEAFGTQNSTGKEHSWLVWQKSAYAWLCKQTKKYFKFYVKYKSKSMYGLWEGEQKDLGFL